MIHSNSESDPVNHTSSSITKSKDSQTAWAATLSNEEIVDREVKVAMIIPLRDQTVVKHKDTATTK